MVHRIFTQQIRVSRQNQFQANRVKHWTVFITIKNCICESKQFITSQYLKIIPEPLFNILKLSPNRSDTAKKTQEYKFCTEKRQANKQ